MFLLPILCAHVEMTTVIMMSAAMAMRLSINLKWAGVDRSCVKGKNECL